MSYKHLILKRAQRELAALAHNPYERVKNAILSLGHDPRPPGCVKLVAREGWPIRVGDYRVVYGIDDQTSQESVESPAKEKTRAARLKCRELR